jgi:DNA modification methylase
MTTTRQIINGDCMTELRKLPAESVQCCVTSPPYWGLREYLFDKATVMRDDLTQDEQTFIEAELRKRGINPRVQAP